MPLMMMSLILDKKDGKNKNKPGRGRDLDLLGSSGSEDSDTARATLERACVASSVVSSGPPFKPTSCSGMGSIKLQQRNWCKT